MFKHALILSMITLCSCAILYGQNAEDVDYYLNDGGLSKRKNLIKLNPISIISGEVPFFYERIFSKSFGMEVGVGVLLPYYNPEFPELIWDNPIGVTNPVGGYSWYLFPKLYLGRGAPESTYVGFQVRKRNFDTDVGDKVFADLTVNFGGQSLVFKSMILELNWGLGFRLETDEANDIKNEVQGLALPFIIKICYLF